MESERCGNRSKRDSQGYFKMKKFLIKLSSFLFLTEIVLRIFWNPPDLDERYARNDFKWLKESVILNSMNWRDKEYDQDNKNGNYRIVILGASFAFGWYIDDVDKTFPRLLEKNLAKKFPSQSFDVINASRHGFSLAEQLARLKNEAIWSHPNLVIAAVNFGEFSSTSKPLFSPPKFLTDSYIYQTRVVKLLKRWGNNTQQIGYKNGFSENSPEFTTVTQNLLQMKHLSAQNNAKFAILIFPELDPFSPNSDYLHKDYHEELSRFAQKNDIAVIDPLELFLDVPDRAKLIINPADPHPSELAHELVIREIINQYDFGEALRLFKPLSSKIKVGRINNLGDRLDGFKHLRKFIGANNNQYPPVYFERKNGSSVESHPLFNSKDRKVIFLEDKIKTVNSYTHQGWPGAVIEYNLEPNGNKIVLSDLYGFPVLGIKQFTAFWRNEEKHSEVAEWLLPKSVTLNNGELTIIIDPKKNYYLYRIEVIVGVEQLDIEEDGTISDITATKMLEEISNEDSNKISFDTNEKIGSYPTFLLSNGSFPWVFVDGRMVLAKSAAVEDGSFLLEFNRVINKGSKVWVPITVRSDQTSNFIIEYE